MENRSPQCIINLSNLFMERVFQRHSPLLDSVLIDHVFLNR